MRKYASVPLSTRPFPNFPVVDTALISFAEWLVPEESGVLFPLICSNPYAATRCAVGRGACGRPATQVKLEGTAIGPDKFSVEPLSSALGQLKVRKPASE